MLLPMTARMEHQILAGAVLMDLQLVNRIDTDLDKLHGKRSDPARRRRARSHSGGHRRRGRDARHAALGGTDGPARSRDPRAGDRQAGLPGHPRRARRRRIPVPDAGGGARAALPADERRAGARQAPHHAGTVQQRHPRPRRHRDHQLGRRLRRLAEAPDRGGAGEGAQADPDRQPAGSGRTGSGDARADRTADGPRCAGRCRPSAVGPRLAAGGQHSRCRARPEVVLPPRVSASRACLQGQDAWPQLRRHGRAGGQTCSWPARNACICTPQTRGIRSARSSAPPASC